MFDDMIRNAKEMNTKIFRYEIQMMTADSTNISQSIAHVLSLPEEKIEQITIFHVPPKKLTNLPMPFSNFLMD